ncbi:MAG TPA: sugar ABC transporter permease [Chloroflexota bacterium]|nr:sugar ABC transporter permease [Chloroflexota bacterium]
MTVAPTTIRAARQRRSGTTRDRRRAIAGYLWISPWLLGFVIFYLGPTLASLYLSFTDYNVVSPPVWIGVSNYVYAFTKDPQFWNSLVKSFTYALEYVPAGVVISLGLALLLTVRFWGTAFYRTIFFLPGLTPVVAAVLIWQWIFDPQVGPVDYVLNAVGINGPGWLGSTKWALLALVIIVLWSSVGANRMVVFIASLEGVPQELYDAAKVDGAGRFARFWHVTVPMISPATYFNLVLATIAALQVFEVAFLTTNGGPDYATWFYMLQLYQEAFVNFDMGYASALAWIFVSIVVGLTYLQVRWSESWVHYEGGD